MTRLALVLIWLAGAALAEGDRPGVFDYYVLSLSWTPTWCALGGDDRASPQCDAGQGYGFTLHGLWPQYDEGWPSDCQTPEPAPSRGQTAEMVDIMGSAGLAWHQWRKHGTCTGLPPADYYRLSRLAYEGVARPDLLRRLEETVRLPAEVIEEAFLEANPALADNMVTVTCRAGHLQEVRICLTRDLDPRACGQDVAQDCTLRDAVFPPMR
jgi:ribonuclease T2